MLKMEVPGRRRRRRLRLLDVVKKDVDIDGMTVGEARLGLIPRGTKSLAPAVNIRISQIWAQ